MGLELNDELEFEDDSRIYSLSTSEEAEEPHSDDSRSQTRSQSAEVEYEELVDHFGNSVQSDVSEAEQKAMETASHLTLDIDFASSSYFADEEAEIKNQMLSLNNLRVPTKSTSTFGRSRAQTAGS